MTTKRTQKVLVVGAEKEALKILFQKGLQVYLWSPLKAPIEYRDRLQGHLKQSYEIGLSDFKKIWGKVFGKTRMDFVIATTEKSVLAAARAQDAFGIKESTHSIAQFFRHKNLMKEKLSEHQVPMTPFIYCKGKQKLDSLVDKLGLPLVVKESATSGSRGLVISSDRAELKKINLKGMIAEKFVEGIEFSVESFISQGEIVFTNITEYYQKAHINIVPGRLETSLKQQLLELNEKVIKTLGATHGMTHLEVFLHQEQFLFGEVALRPPGGFIMDLLKLCYDFDPWAAYIDTELGLSCDFSSLKAAHVASIILHPGQGVIKEVRGYEEIKALPECSRFHLKATVGDYIETRVGLGQNIGHILFKAQSRSRLLECLDYYQKQFFVELEQPQANAG